ncbi:MAG: alpha/beta hydrolase [Planctomycetales bacterium]
MRARIGLFAILFLGLGAVMNSANAADPQVIPLWPNGAPGAKGNTEKDQPTLTVFPAPKSKGTTAAFIVCPGGGYGGLATTYEGTEVCEYFQSLGITACMLKYRLTPYKHPIMLGDAQRAVRVVRSKAGEWNIDPQKIGVLGFSAGGHLVSTLGTHFDAGKPDAEDPIDRLSCRPDAIVLCYPVVAMGTEYGHKGSEKNLLGDNPDPKLVASLSNHTQVTAETPPTFLFHTGADTGVPAENSVLFYMALRRAKVPAEMHIFQNGPHGVGLGKKEPATHVLPVLLATWLRVQGFVK